MHEKIDANLAVKYISDLKFSTAVDAIVVILLESNVSLREAEAICKLACFKIEHGKHDS